MLSSDLARQFRRIRSRIGQAEAKAGPLYLEGTYTPTYLGGTTPGVTTYTLQAGFYVRTGRLVTCWGAVVWTAATGTGTATISLPFTATADTNANFSGSVRVVNVTFANSTPQIAFGATATGWTMVSPLTNAAGAAVAVEAAGNLVWTITYAVD